MSKYVLTVFELETVSTDNNPFICYHLFAACSDAARINPMDMLSGTCNEQAGFMCLDRGCEDPPEGGVPGWRSACCGGYAYEWAGGPEPSKNTIRIFLVVL